MIAILAAAVPTAAIAKVAVIPPEPMERPDFAKAAKRSLGFVMSSLIDPSSANTEWVNGYHWISIKPPFASRKTGWVACFTVNAKNRLGGYTARQNYFSFLTPDDKLIVQESLNPDTCSDTTPLQAGMIESRPNLPSQAAPFSLARELTKLAELREKGILTHSEFEAQKAKVARQID